MKPDLLCPLLSPRISARVIAQFQSVEALISAARSRVGIDSGLLLVADAVQTIDNIHLATMHNSSDVLSSPHAVRAFVHQRLIGRVDEVFMVLYLDNQNRLIEAREEFRGSLSQTAVYPRVIVRTALQLNAGALVMVHNHPSGMAEASIADRSLTDALKSACSYLELRVLDHLIVAGADVLSFAEQGLM